MSIKKMIPMLTLLLILAVYTVASVLVRWANKPTKGFKPLTGGKSLAQPKSVFDIMFPKLED